MLLPRIAIGCLLVAGLAIAGGPPPMVRAAAGLPGRQGRGQPIAVASVERIPPGMQSLLKGKLKQGFRWSDLNGDNWLMLTETGEFAPPARRRKSEGTDDLRQAELYAYRFVSVGGAFSQAWRVTDFVRDCPVDITAEFIPAATEVTDLDGDGFAEAWVMYRIACRGDVSPATVKIIMYENNQKHALRGNARVALPDFAEGGDYQPDAALRANRAFLQHAERKWRRFCQETFQ